MLRLEASVVVELTGPLVSDISSLSGALLTVCGQRERTRDPALQAITFELRTVDGMQAYLGVLGRISDGYAIDLGNGRPLVPLIGVPRELSSRIDSLVWVAGLWSEVAFAVKSFGALTTTKPPTKPTKPAT